MTKVGHKIWAKLAYGIDHQLVKGAGYLCKPITFKIWKIRNLNRGGRHSPDFKRRFLKNASLLCSLHSCSLLLHKKGTFSEEQLPRVDREFHLKAAYPDSPSLCFTHASRLTVGRALHSTLLSLCSRTFLLITGMLSALSQIILANVVFLISPSMAALNAVRSVFKLGFGAFSCQKRSPTLRRRNCSATMH